MLHTDEQALAHDASLVGQLFETFVATELIPHLETASNATEMFHFRDRSGHEVDFVLERRGRVTGVEVKSSTRVTRHDAAGLAWLRDRLGDSFHLGAVLYSGQLPYRIGDRLWALPISFLWRRREPSS